MFLQLIFFLLVWNANARTLSKRADILSPCTPGKGGAILYHTHPSDLTKYIQCENGIAIERKCAPGTYWNQGSVTCTVADDLKKYLATTPGKDSITTGGFPTFPVASSLPQQQQLPPPAPGVLASPSVGPATGTVAGNWPTNFQQFPLNSMALTPDLAQSLGQMISAGAFPSAGNQLPFGLQNQLLSSGIQPGVQGTTAGNVPPSSPQPTGQSPLTGGGIPFPGPMASSLPSPNFGAPRMIFPPGGGPIPMPPIMGFPNFPGSMPSGMGPGPIMFPPLVGSAGGNAPIGMITGFGSPPQTSGPSPSNFGGLVPQSQISPQNQATAIGGGPNFGAGLPSQAASLGSPQQQQGSSVSLIPGLQFGSPGQNANDFLATLAGQSSATFGQQGNSGLDSIVSLINYASPTAPNDQTVQYSPFGMAANSASQNPFALSNLVGQISGIPTL